MNKLLIAPLLVLAAACASPGDGLVPLEADGPVMRTIERVLDRVEAYAAQPPADIVLEVDQAEMIQASALTARTMTSGPDVSGAMLYVVMDNLMDFHDQMVMWDDTLDPLEQDIYIEDTMRLRSLFNAVSIHSEN